jgi:hypothetical protein
MSAVERNAPGEDPLARPELLELYKIAIDEYRFQVALNSKREQYYLATNAAILTVGAGLLRLESNQGLFLTACVFLAGLGASVVSTMGMRTQKGYYRATADRMVLLGARLGLGELAMRATPRFSTQRRWIRMTTSTTALLAGIGVIDSLGFLNTVFRIVASSPWISLGILPAITLSLRFHRPSFPPFPLG